MRKSIIMVTIIFHIHFLVPSAFGAQYKYDNLNRLTRVTYDDGMQIIYTYDEVGNRAQRFSTLLADSSIDGFVDFKDYAIMAYHWLEEECGYLDDWCEGADIDWSTAVNIEDLAVLAEQWIEGAK